MQTNTLKKLQANTSQVPLLFVYLSFPPAPGGNCEGSDNQISTNPSELTNLSQGLSFPGKAGRIEKTIIANAGSPFNNITKDLPSLSGLSKETGEIVTLPLISLRESGKPKNLSEIKENIFSYSFNKSQSTQIMNSLSIGNHPLALSSSPASSGALSYSPFMIPNCQINLINNNSLGEESFNLLKQNSLKKANKSKAGNWIVVKDLQIILTSCFKTMCSLISKVKLKVTNDKVVIELFYHILIPDANIYTLFDLIFNKNQFVDAKKKRNKLIRFLSKKKKQDLLFKLNFLSLNYLNVVRFKFLAYLLNGIFNRPIVFECIRLHHSDAESNILAQLLILILKKKNIRSVINKLFNKKKVKDINFMNLQTNPFGKNLNDNNLYDLGNMIPVFISGLYIHINGRLMREPIIPRLTTKKFEKGAIATGKVSSLDQTQITHKNRKGSFTVKITFAQNCI